MVSGGSSPRAWGTPPLRCGLLDAGRFIPTRVGNTPEISASAIAKSVHPHARGEHFIQGVGACAQNGSSPRAWGTHFLHPVDVPAILDEENSTEEKPAHRILCYQIVKERPSLPQPEERKQVLRHRVLPVSACWSLASQNRTLPRCSCARP